MSYILIGLILLIILIPVALSILSRQVPPLGLVDGKLRPCPDLQNCVCSEDKGEAFFVAPLTFDVSTEVAWNNIKDVIQDMGGTLEKEQDLYLWATFTTPLFRFVDDVEIRMVEINNMIHIRSASRVGRSDMGLNRKRIEKLRQHLNQKMSQ